MTPPDSEVHFDELLQFLRSLRGFDFSNYKRAGLMRRVRRRMQALGIESFTDYQDYLEVHPDEFVDLFNTILINVTGFFRDAEHWEFLAREIIPRILQNKAPNESIRVWSAGCASGEEAYTLAMLWAEALGPEQFRERVKIYATDVDEDALNKARQGGYAQRDLKGLPQELLERYFERVRGQYVFNRDLRRSIIFGRHDLLTDAPISRVDLLVCRNTLMYFNTEAQAKILVRFAFSLNEGGFLFLGRAEMLMTQNPLFVALEAKRRIFTKRSRDAGRDQLPAIAAASRPVVHNDGADPVLMQTSFQSAPVAALVVDARGYVVAANDLAQSMFGIAPKDLGRPFRDFEVSYRPAELRSVIESVMRGRTGVVLDDIPWTAPSGAVRRLSIQVVPLVSGGGRPLGAMVTFFDSTETSRLEEELLRTREALETAQEEVQSTNEELEATNEELRSTVEELETAYEEVESTNEELEATNEELQSTVEELETTNEELQSANEELETMNEELESANEEMDTVNVELRERTEQLNEAKGFLEMVLNSFPSAVIVLDRNLLIRSWNAAAQDLWGLRADECIGSHILTLDAGLPTEQLAQPMRNALQPGAGQQQLLVDAVNRRGRSIHCRITCLPLLGATQELEGIVLLMDVLGE